MTLPTETGCPLQTALGNPLLSHCLLGNAGSLLASSSDARQTFSKPLNLLALLHAVQYELQH